MDRLAIIVALIYCLHCSLADVYTLVDNGNVTTSRTENELHKHLFKTYIPDIIPTLDDKPVIVNIEFFLIAIDDVDEKKQTIAVRAFLEVTWVDEKMTWDKANFSGVDEINVKNEALWIPDLTLTGTLGSLLDVGQTGGRAKVESNGKVTMWPYKLYTLACKIAVAKFPMDEQRCDFDFLSWTNPTTVIQLRNPSGVINIESMSESGEWDVKSQPTNIWQKTFGEDKWDHLTFQLLLRRKWLFHALNTMTPVVCISLLNVLCFLLPAQSGERVTLCISIFLTLAVFLTVINNAMPESSEEVAVFGLYVGLQLIGSALTIFHVVLSIFLFHRDNAKPVPLIFRIMIKVCCVNPAKNASMLGKYSSCGALENGPIDKSGAIETKAQVSWKLVSLALDRMCLVGAVIWHTSLFLYLIHDLNN